MNRATVRFVVRRTLQAVLVIVLSYTLTFSALFVLPGDPIYNKLHNPINPLPATAVRTLEDYYHLDYSPVHQYLLSLERLLTGDVGYSLVTGQPVTGLLGKALPQTAALATGGLLVALTLSLSVAVAAVFVPWAPVRNLARLLPGAFLSVPSFVLGFLILQVFSFELGWFSAVESQGAWSYVLPSATLGIAVSGPLAQVLIAGLARARAEPFVTVLRAKGVPPLTLTGRHILKNGSIPALTLLSLTVGDLLAGAVVVETVFNMTGLGLTTQQATRDQDTPVLMAIVLMVSAVYVFINLVVDLVYPLIDPRISITAPRPERAAGRLRLPWRAWRAWRVWRAGRRPAGREVAA
jgi:peptide/nickel transport system permease protein